MAAGDIGKLPFLSVRAVNEGNVVNRIAQTFGVSSKKLELRPQTTWFDAWNVREAEVDHIGRLPDRDAVAIPSRQRGVGLFFFAGPRQSTFI